MEFTMHAERSEVELQALALHAESVRLVVQHYFSEVGLAGYGAEAGKLRAFDMDCPYRTSRIIFSRGKGTGKSLQQ